MTPKEFKDVVAFVDMLPLVRAGKGPLTPVEQLGVVYLQNEKGLAVAAMPVGVYNEILAYKELHSHTLFKYTLARLDAVKEHLLEAEDVATVADARKALTAAKTELEAILAKVQQAEKRLSF